MREWTRGECKRNSADTNLATLLYCEKNIIRRRSNGLYLIRICIFFNRRVINFYFFLPYFWFLLYNEVGGF